MKDIANELCSSVAAYEIPCELQSQLWIAAFKTGDPCSKVLLLIMHECAKLNKFNVQTVDFIMSLLNLEVDSGCLTFCISSQWLMVYLVLAVMKDIKVAQKSIFQYHFDIKGGLRGGRVMMQPHCSS